MAVFVGVEPLPTTVWLDTLRNFNAGLWPEKRVNLNYLLQLAVWSKAAPSMFGADYGFDAYGNLIKRSEYGNRNSQYGWEIDHYPTPKALGGSEDLSNLRPLHCKANAKHGGILGNALRTMEEPGGLLGSLSEPGLFGGSYRNALKP